MTEPMTETPTRAVLDELDVLDALLAAATPGPWISDSHEIYQAIPGLPDISGDWLGETCRIEGDPNHATSVADAAVIVALRNTAPRLLAAIRAAYTLAEQLEGRKRLYDGVDAATALRAALDEALGASDE